MANHQNIQLYTIECKRKPLPALKMLPNLAIKYQEESNQAQRAKGTMQNAELLQW